MPQLSSTSHSSHISPSACTRTGTRDRNSGRNAGSGEGGDCYQSRKEQRYGTSPANASRPVIQRINPVSQREVGFLKDKRRLNVAMTRARRHLVGNLLGYNVIDTLNPVRSVHRGRFVNCATRKSLPQEMDGLAGGECGRALRGPRLILPFTRYHIEYTCGLRAHLPCTVHGHTMYSI